MDKNDVHASLVRLRGELKRLEFGDASARQHMEQLIAEIEAHADNDGRQQSQTLAAKISETVRRFEVEHPALTGYLGEIAAALS